MSNLIKQTVTFKASPHEVYEALMDSAKHAAFTGGAAEISREVGGPDKKIVQSWRAVDWDEGYFSRVMFEFTAIPEGTRLDFVHTDVPDGTEEEFTQGWIDNYWEPMKKYLEK
jgi:activator of HSP90 ATPase